MGYKERFAAGKGTGYTKNLGGKRFHYAVMLCNQDCVIPWSMKGLVKDIQKLKEDLKIL